MRQFKRLRQNIINSYRARGFLSFSKNALSFLMSKYNPWQIIKRFVSQKKHKRLRIFYIDYFIPENSNSYWLRAFKKFGQVKIFDIRKQNVRLLKKQILSFKPNHIHLGGSVKNNLIKPEFLKAVNAKTQATISVFHGDGPLISAGYHTKLSKAVNYIYATDMSLIEANQKLHLKNFKYLPCPTNPKIFKHYNLAKKYDVIFVGNNNQPSRLPLLNTINKLYNLTVFGNGWQTTNFNHQKPVYGKKFSRVCSQAKICLNIATPTATNFKQYFSNRLINTLATRSFCLTPYTPGLEKTFTNKKHLVWYQNEQELLRLINLYLKQPQQCQKIARQGQKKVYSQYTFEKSAARILADVKKLNTLKLHLGCGSNLLANYVNIDKYNPAADQKMDAVRLRYADNCVDKILTSHMVEHMSCPEFLDALQEWKRVLKENGLLIIRCPNFEKHLRLWLEADYQTRWGQNNEGINGIIGFQGRGPGYINRNLFTVKRLKNLVSQAGFQIIQCQTYPTRTQHLPDGDILLKAAKPKLSPLDKDWQNALKDKKRFSLAWYKKHCVTQELLKAPIWQGHIGDLGCGVAAKSFLALKKYQKIRITGIDASFFALDYAKKHFMHPHLNLIYSNLLKTPLPQSYFNNAFMLEVIEHIPNTFALLQEIKRIVKNKGILFISTTEKNYHRDPHHVHIFTKQTLQKTLESNKLRILDIYVKEHIIFTLVQV